MILGKGENALDELRRITEVLVTREDSITNEADLLSRAYSSLPVPVWVKDTGSRMLFCNKAYEEAYGKDITYYIGRNDIDLWGEEVAAAFRKNDLKVLESKKPYLTTEQFPSASAGRKIYGHVCKFPILERHRVVAIGGIVLGYV